MQPKTDDQQNQAFLSAIQITHAMERRDAELKQQLQTIQTNRAIVRDQIAQLTAKEEALDREILVLSGEIKETAFWLGNVRSSMNPQPATMQFLRPVESNGENQDGSDQGDKKRNAAIEGDNSPNSEG